MHRTLPRVSELLLCLAVLVIVDSVFAQKKPQQQQQVRPARTRPSEEWHTIDTQPSYGGNGGYGWGGGAWGGGGGTVAGNYYSGVANAVRAAGDYNLSTSQAYVNMEEAKRRDIENRKEWTDSYFEMRRANADYRAAERGPRGTPEDWVRYAREAAPARLSPGQLDQVTGEIAWPRLLQAAGFKEGREELEHQFAIRADKGGSIGPNGYQQIQEVTNSMIAYLKKNIKSYPTNEYLDAKKFLESLAYEARFTTG
jgi:hypothetical protein